jgi:hypothetical protein
MGVLLLSLGGCASTAQTEALQLAYSGDGPNPCLFGGVSERANQHCAAVKSGSSGLLMAINHRALLNLSEDPADHPCQIHVARLEKALQEHPQYSAQRIYSCPDNAAGMCHVSLLVSDPSGELYVMDNGAVLDPALYSSSVASLDEYAGQLNNIYWLNYLPDNAREIAMARHHRS